ncbi:SbcC/MukB-like Walker B domain-containing protein [Oceaniserpentilla sp. 4NH20-0058]|uniref:ATP-binding protein n=1 Tax=Oceaniserpentilla sp. 4NH20-0058 TaxID=3127660 RepID=UPI00310B1DF4
MFLKKFVYVNWGNIPATDFEFGPINLLSGGNGSGKTTAADAIQTIMTAAHDNLFNYNPGQDEATQKGRGKQVRTLASYVLGCDDGSYARPGGANGYLAAVFHPTQGESGQPFTAIIGVSAYIDKAGNQAVARQSDFLLMIVAGHELTQSDFLLEESDSKQVVAVDKIFKRLQKRCGQKAVEKYDTKKQYLRRLYSALRGRDDAVSEREALNAAKAFSRFMAYKPVKSINGFVANEILEKKDLGEAIRSVSDLMKTIHAMESDAQGLIENINILLGAKSNSQTYIDQWIDYQVAHYVAAKSRYVEDQSAYRDAKNQQQQLRSDLNHKQNERETAESRRKQSREELVGLEARRQGIPALKDKDHLEQEIEGFKKQLQQQAILLLEQDKQLKYTLDASKSIYKTLQNTSVGVEIPALNERKFLSQGKQVVALADSDQLDFPAILNKDMIDISPLEAHLDDGIQRQEQINQWRELWFNAELTTEGVSLRDQLARLADRREQKLQSQHKKMQQIQQDMDRLHSSQVSYPYFVEAALDAIRREYPQADPKVLCDYVEVLDSDWQNAIEGYIGGARFSIVVEEDYESDAISIVRNMPGGNRARVIQGSKAKQDADRQKVPHNSIMHLMKFEHATAKHYLMASYGSVEQVPDAQALRKTRRGLTKQGMGSGSYSMYRCDMSDTELVFGQGARERALSAKQREFQQLAEQASNAQQNQREAQDLLLAVNQLRHLAYADQLQQMVSVNRQWRNAEKQLDQIDLSDFSLLEDEYRELAEQAQTLDEQIQRLDGELGRTAQQLKESEKRCAVLSDQQEFTAEKADSNEDNLRSISKVWPDFDVEKCLIEADEEAARTTAEIAQNQQQAILSELNSRAQSVDRAIAEHNQRCQTLDAIVYAPDYTDEHSARFFQDICDVQREVDRIHNRLKNNILVEKQDKLSSLKDSFDNAFVTNLCHAIYQAISEGKRTLEDMNSELRHHRFGTDKECYWFDWEWVPEFKDYWNFFEEVIKNPSIGEGQTLFEVELSQKSAKVRSQLMEMLLSDDEQKAMRELERLSDYRNYRNYEIYKQPEGKEPIALSQYGTGSGGQLETPAYIIRSAAITSAFRFNKGDTHLRMVLVDEAFSKMDETRSKEVINYLTESLGLQLLFIMPTSKSGPFMDLISNQYVFSKVPLAAGKRGELNTRVLVDRQQCNKEKIQDLWAHHRRVVRQQAELDFMEEFA